jgi:CheY-like chemotaxis protein
LIVDDEPLLAEYMASVAEDFGWATELAANDERFEALIEKSRPDVVALDLAMPGRDGVELLRQLAANGFSGSLIIVSACDHPIVESSARLAREHGLAVLGYMQKPITAEAFTSFLQQAEEASRESAFDRRH